MTTTQHTQGPWEAEEHGVIRGRNGMIRPFICQVQDDHNDEETQANAHLIAAAPELLSALSNILEDHKRMFPEAHPNSTIAWEECEEVRAAFAAIAKAEGRAE